MSILFLVTLVLEDDLAAGAGVAANPGECQGAIPDPQTVGGWPGISSFQTMAVGQPSELIPIDRIGSRSKELTGESTGPAPIGIEIQDPGLALVDRMIPSG